MNERVSWRTHEVADIAINDREWGTIVVCQGEVSLSLYDPRLNDYRIFVFDLDGMGGVLDHLRHGIAQHGYEGYIDHLLAQVTP